MKFRETVECISSVACILYKKNNDDILKNTIIVKLQESFKSILVLMTFDNQQLYISNIYITGDLNCLAILFCNDISSSKQCIKCKLHWKVWLECGHKIGDD